MAHSQNSLGWGLGVTLEKVPLGKIRMPGLDLIDDHALASRRLHVARYAGWLWLSMVVRWARIWSACGRPRSV